MYTLLQLDLHSYRRNVDAVIIIILHFTCLSIIIWGKQPNNKFLQLINYVRSNKIYITSYQTNLRLLKNLNEIKDKESNIKFCSILHNLLIAKTCCWVASLKLWSKTCKVKDNYDDSVDIPSVWMQIKLQ